MKKLIPITLISVSLFLSACGLKDIVGPKAASNSNSNSSPGGTTNSDSYQPVVKGSTWTYSVEAFGFPAGNATISITGDVQTINNTTFFKSQTINPGGDTQFSFCGSRGNLFLNYDPDTRIEQPYLDISKPAGASFNTAVNDPNNPGVPARYVTTIVEKDVTKTINSRSFKNVIHTRVEMQYDYGSGYVAETVEELYVAKGVGIVEWDTSAAFLTSTPSLVSKLIIVSYDIK